MQTGGKCVRWPYFWVHIIAAQNKHTQLKILYCNFWEYCSFLPLLHPTFLCAVCFCLREVFCHWFIQISSPAPHTGSLCLTPTTTTKNQTPAHQTHEPDLKASILLVRVRQWGREGEPGKSEQVYWKEIQECSTEKKELVMCVCTQRLELKP